MKKKSWPEKKNAPLPGYRAATTVTLLTGKTLGLKVGLRSWWHLTWYLTYCEERKKLRKQKEKKNLSSFFANWTPPVQGTGGVPWIWTESLWKTCFPESLFKWETFNVFFFNIFFETKKRYSFKKKNHDRKNTLLSGHRSGTTVSLLTGLVLWPWSVIFGDTKTWPDLGLRVGLSSSWHPSCLPWDTWESCLLWIDKTRAKDKTYIWVSVWWKTKN